MGDGPHDDDNVIDFSAHMAADDEIIIDPKAPLDTARQLVKSNHVKNGMRMLHHQQSIFSRWTGTHYREQPSEETRADVYGFLEKAMAMGKDGPKIFKPNTNSVSQVVDALRAACQIPNNLQPPAWVYHFATNPPPGEIISCVNGLLHLPTGRVHPHTPAFYATSSLSYTYDRNAPEPTEWLRFLHNIWEKDPDSITALQDIFGYLLGTDTDQQKLFLLVGPKRSGKGTIGRILNILVGEDAVISPTLASLQTNFGIAPLIGKSVALIADARLGSRADQHAIAERLLSISGEDKQTIDRKFLPAWSGKLGTRFLVMTNELPRIADASGALASRFVVLTMTKSFYGQEDRGLLQRLLPEMPSILNWAIEGWRRVKSRGHFIQPASAAESVQELEDLGSPVSAFVRERCVIAAGQFVEIGQLYDAWVVWCKDQGRDHTGTKQSLGRDLRAVFSNLTTSQPREGENRLRYYEGIGLRYVVDNNENTI